MKFTGTMVQMRESQSVEGRVIIRDCDKQEPDTKVSACLKVIHNG